MAGPVCFYCGDDAQVKRLNGAGHVCDAHDPNPRRRTQVVPKLNVLKTDDHADLLAWVTAPPVAPTRTATAPDPEVTPCSNVDSATPPSTESTLTDSASPAARTTTPETTPTPTSTDAPSLEMPAPGSEWTCTATFKDAEALERAYAAVLPCPPDSGGCSPSPEVDAPTATPIPPAGAGEAAVAADADAPSATTSPSEVPTMPDPKTCGWPKCAVKHAAGGFCSQDYKRVRALGYRPTKDAPLAADILPTLPERWAVHVAASRKAHSEAAKAHGFGRVVGRGAREPKAEPVFHLTPAMLKVMADAGYVQGKEPAVEWLIGRACRCVDLATERDDFRKQLGVSI